MRGDRSETSRCVDGLCTCVGKPIGWVTLSRTACRARKAVSKGWARRCERKQAVMAEESPEEQHGGQERQVSREAQRWD